MKAAPALLAAALAASPAAAELDFARADSAQAALFRAAAGARAMPSAAAAPRRPADPDAVRQDPRRSARIDAVLARLLVPGGPGASVAVVKDGRIVHLQGYGLADIAGKTPIGPETRFDLASCSKQFTALAVLLLAERGGLRLEDPARDYLPEIAYDDPRRPIRVADLLSMTAGLADYTEAGSDADYHGMTNEDVAAAMGARPLVFLPGSRYEYSNTAYNMLGLLVKRVSGADLGEFLAANVFARLGMTRSVVLERGGQVIAGRASGYARRGGRFVRDRNDTENLVGDGNVFSTAGDLALWDLALLRGWLVSGASRARAWTSGRLDAGQATGYGFGWEVSADGKTVSHTGSWAGTSAFNAIYQDKDLAVIVLANEAGFPSDLAGRAIARLY